MNYQTCPNPAGALSALIPERNLINFCSMSKFSLLSWSIPKFIPISSTLYQCTTYHVRQIFSLNTVNRITTGKKKLNDSNKMGNYKKPLGYMLWGFH